MASDIIKVGSLEIDQDLQMQKKVWKYQRVGRALMALLVISAFVGLLGPGPLSNRIVTSPNGALTVKAERFVHTQSPVEVKAEFLQAPKNGKAQLWISKSYLENVRVERIEPEPETVTAEGDRNVYTFNVGPGGQGSVVKFMFESEGLGSHELKIGYVGQGEAAIHQFMFP
jgi:hypothetical protein